MELQELMGMTVRGGLLILLACLLRPVLRGRVPRRSILWLWYGAIARLLLPHVVTIRVPMPWRQTQGGGRWYRMQGALDRAAGQPDLWPALCWLLGALALALAIGVLYVAQRRRLREALPLEDRACQGFVERQGLRRPVRVLVSDRIRTPLTYGLLRPRIVLPKGMDRKQPAELLCVLTHEMIHIRRLDVLAKGAALAALCLHWFNPLVWCMVFLLDRDLDQACDERAIALLGERWKDRYALALVALAEQKQGFAPLCSGFGRNGLEERIVSIMKYRKYSRWVAATAAVSMLAVASVSAASLEPAQLEETEMSVHYAGTLTMSQPADGSQTGVPAASDVEVTKDLEPSTLAEDYTAYQALGLETGGTGLTYRGQAVRTFQDKEAGLFYFNEAGTVNLEAVYGADQTLSGLRECEEPEMGNLYYEDGEGNVIQAEGRGYASMNANLERGVISFEAK